MALHSSVSETDLLRLLNLFPIKTLRTAWPDQKGTKEELSKLIAQQRELARISTFVDEYFNVCKQHVHVFGFEPQALPRAFGTARLVTSSEGADPHALYVVRVTYTAILAEPFAEQKLDFLWPVRLDAIGPHVLARFVVLEKNLASYVPEGRPIVRDRRNLEEADILAPLQTALGSTAVDLNKGVKALLVNDFMDARRVQFKKPTSTATETMDERRGIKRDNPEVYEQMMGAPLQATHCVIPANAQRKEVALWIEPSAGTIRFPRYADNMGDTDYVIRQLLQANS